MSDAILIRPALPFEQALYARSPFGLGLTTAILFALFFGSFLAIASLEHVTIFHRTGGFAFTDASWPAFVLSLLCCAALSLQRYARLAEARDAPAYARILTGGMASATLITSPVAREARLLRPTLVGIAVGVVVSVIIRVSEFNEGHVIPPATMVWFGVFTTFMLVLFVRGIEQARAGLRGYAGTLDAELKIDLMRTDTLAVLGRSAARSSLIWFVVSAVGCLFFVSGDLNWLTALLIAPLAAMGVGVFVSIMNRIHKRILAVKAAELEHVRLRIDALRATLHEDAFASASLHGLLAYEKRVSEAQEWPFDQSTLLRVAASALILTVPWFGQAIVQYAVDHLTR
jgi:hypothetical protein